MNEQQAKNSNEFRPILATLREQAHGTLGRFMLPIALASVLSVDSSVAHADHAREDEGFGDQTLSTYSGCSSFGGNHVAVQGLDIINHSSMHTLSFRAVMPFGTFEGESRPSSSAQISKDSSESSVPAEFVDAELTWLAHNSDGSDHTERARLEIPAIDCPRPEGESIVVRGEKYFSPLQGGVGGPEPEDPIAETFTIGNDDPVLTSVQASVETYESAQSVVIATSEAFPDALSSASLAGTVEGPLLLNPSNELSSDVANEITRLGAERAYLVGGTAALSQNVQEALQSAGITTERISGPDRVATAVEVAETINELRGSNNPSNEALLVNGENFADATFAGLIGAENKSPIVLTRTGDLPQATAEYLNQNEADLENIITVGGTAVVPEAIVSQATELATAESTRLAGPERTATSAAVARYFVENLRNNAPVETVVVTNAGSYEGALVAGPMAAAQEGVVPLGVYGDSEQPGAHNAFADFIDDKKTSSLLRLGRIGTGIRGVTDRTFNLLKFIADEYPNNS